MGIYEDLINITAKENVFHNEPMSYHTTFRTGGVADYLVIPQKKEELVALMKLDVPKTLIGNGSNLLVLDGGIRGLVIQTTGLNHVRVQDNFIIAEAGAFVSKISNIAKENSLTGFEFACGIPGTLGGAVLMNASAYGGETASVVVKTEYIDEKGNVCETTDHQFGYRKSMFSESSLIILESTLKLEKGDKTQIEATIAELMKNRCEKQPIEKPSAGSTFKRPEGYFAGKLIEDCGLKGFQIGGAKVSEKHAGFIINDGGATSNDVMQLIHYVQEKVKEQFGVELELEIKVVGEE